jgi:Ca-activated chloride channel family protein
MSFDANDPKWTAYVLDELSFEERQALDAELEGDDDAREYVESLRETTALLEQELMAPVDEPAPKLDDIQRQRVVREAAKAPKRRVWPWVASGVAAAAVVMLFVYAQQGRGEGEHALALSDTNGAEQTESGELQYRSALEAEQGVITAMSEVDETDDRAIKVNSSTPLGDLKREPAKKKRRGDRNRNTSRSRRSGGDNSSAGMINPGLAIGGDGVGYGSTGTTSGKGKGKTKTQRPRKQVYDRPSFDGEPGVAVAVPKQADGHDFNTEEYDHIADNDFVAIADDPLSTFSIDVDTASYSNMRRFVTRSSLPPPAAVRIEEMINYFDYAYAPPTDDTPFAVHVDAAEAPWAPNHRLVRIGLKGSEISQADRPQHNLVFLIDVSGSMRGPNKLPLLQKAMNMLVDNLGSEDRIAIVTYAGSAGVVLESTTLNHKQKVKDAIDALRSGGSTNGAQGIERAYEIATASFAKGGVNRVILATDGDFNVGPSSKGELVSMIEKKAKSGVFLTVLGFGMGNLNDATLEQLADHGNGNYAYIDTMNEAKKVLVTEIAGTLVTIAKDVKIQVEFNPNLVASYRLIGYENRVLAHQDFNDDTKDAGEIGSGHTVTALYEIVPATEGSASASTVDDLKYQTPRGDSTAADSGELLTVKLRYKDPDGDSSKLIERAYTDSNNRMVNAAPSMALAAAVAEFGMLLRDSKHKGDANFAHAKQLAEQAARTDPHGYRAELLELISTASGL